MRFLVITDLKPDDLIMLYILAKIYDDHILDIVITKISNYRNACTFLHNILSHKNINFSWYNIDPYFKSYEMLYNKCAPIDINKFDASMDHYDKIFVFAPFIQFILDKILDKYFDKCLEIFLTCGYNTGKNASTISYIETISKKCKVILINNYASYNKKGGIICLAHPIVKLLCKIYGDDLFDIILNNTYFFIANQMKKIILNNKKSKDEILSKNIIKWLDSKSFRSLKSLKSQTLLLNTLLEKIKTITMIDNKYDEFLNIIKMLKSVDDNDYISHVLEIVENKDQWINKNFDIEITDGQEMCAYILYDSNKLHILPCKLVLNENNELRIIKSDNKTNIYCFFDTDIDFINKELVKMLN